MSYIRCLSNPEGLYIIHDGTHIEIMCKGDIKTLPASAFEGVMRRYLDEQLCEAGDAVAFEGARLEYMITESDDWKWIFSYQGKDGHGVDQDWRIEMWKVTLEYIARNVAGRN